MTTPLILLGYGGNVVDVLDMVDDLNDAAGAGSPRYEVLGYLDPRDELQGTAPHGYPVLGRLSDAPRYVQQYGNVRFTTWIGRVDTYRLRPERIASLGVPPERFESLVHPTSYLSRRATLGRGALVFQQCTVSNHRPLRRARRTARSQRFEQLRAGRAVQRQPAIDGPRTHPRQDTDRGVRPRGPGSPG